MRWRVTRATLQLGADSTSAECGVVLDCWLRDGRSPLPELESPAPLHLNQTSYSVLPPGPVVLRAFRELKDVYPAAVVESGLQTKFVAYVSEGSVLSMGPYHSSSLSVSFCRFPSRLPRNCSSSLMRALWVCFRGDLAKA